MQGYLFIDINRAFKDWVVIDQDFEINAIIVNLDRLRVDINKLSDIKIYTEFIVWSEYDIRCKYVNFEKYPNEDKLLVFDYGINSFRIYFQLQDLEFVYKLIKAHKV